LVNAKLPPNGPKNQQFKDSVIWQVVLALSADFTTHLVSMDWGFFRVREDPSSGLAPNLKEDCRSVETVIKLHYDLASCLIVLTRETPVFDEPRLVSLIYDALMPRLRTEMARRGFGIIEAPEIKTQVFKTTVPNRLS